MLFVAVLSLLDSNWKVLRLAGRKSTEFSGSARYILVFTM